MLIYYLLTLVGTLGTHAGVHAFPCSDELVCFTQEIALDEFKRGLLPTNRTICANDGINYCLRRVVGNRVMLECGDFNPENAKLPGCSETPLGHNRGNCNCETVGCNGEIYVGPYGSPVSPVKANNEKTFECYSCVDTIGVKCAVVTCKRNVTMCVTRRSPVRTERTCGKRCSNSSVGCFTDSHKVERCYCNSQKCNNARTAPALPALPRLPGLRCHVCVEKDGADCPITNCGVHVKTCVTMKREGRVERACGPNVTTHREGCYSKMVDSVATEFCYCVGEKCNNVEMAPRLPGLLCLACVEEDGADCPITNCGVHAHTCVTMKSEGKVERACGHNVTTSRGGCYSKMVASVETEFCHCVGEMCNSKARRFLAKDNAMEMSASVLVIMMNLQVLMVLF